MSEFTFKYIKFQRDAQNFCHDMFNYSSPEETSNDRSNLTAFQDLSKSLRLLTLSKRRKPEQCVTKSRGFRQ